MAQKTVADLPVGVLANPGIQRIYSLSCYSRNWVTKPIRGYVRPKAVAASAAGTEAHFTGSLSVCAGSCSLLSFLQGYLDQSRQGFSIGAGSEKRLDVSRELIGSQNGKVTLQ